MKNLIKYFKIIIFGKFYFASGTFEYKGERKWFRISYRPESGYVSENEILKIFEEKTNYKPEYFVVTNFFRISRKQHLKI